MSKARVSYMTGKQSFPDGCMTGKHARTVIFLACQGELEGMSPERRPLVAAMVSQQVEYCICFLGNARVETSSSLFGYKFI